MSYQTNIEIMGKTYHIKCLEAEENAVRRSAQYLEEKMRLTRESGVLNSDRMAVITALNMAHQLLALEQQKDNLLQNIQQRVQELECKVDDALDKR